MASPTTNEGKNILIVYAHQDCHSFNWALKNVAVEALEEAGFNVKVSDLYAMHFKATTTKDDIRGKYRPWLLCQLSSMLISACCVSE